MVVMVHANSQVVTACQLVSLRMMKNKPVIECRDLKKSFGNKTVLQDINLTVYDGSVLALVGSNGAGKTTLLKILATLITPTGGRACICGNDVLLQPHRVQKSMGFVSSEERSFYWRLTGRQNLDFFAALHGIAGRERKETIENLLKKMGHDEERNKRFREYSSGMKQVLCIIRAMLHDPPVLLLDEPTKSLSPDVAKRVRGIVGSAVKDHGKTVVIASHNLHEVEDIADHIVIMDHGVIKAGGSIKELRMQRGVSPSSNLDRIFEYYTGKG